MTMDVSTLAIEVKSSGISQAVSGLNDLAKAADAAEKSAKRLTDAIASVMKGSPTAQLTQMAGAMSSVSSATQSLNSTLSLLGSNLTSIIPALNNYTSATSTASSAVAGHSRNGGVFTNTLKAMSAAFIYYKTVNVVMSLVAEADAWQTLQARLTTTTGSMHNAIVAQNQMFEVSQRVRVPLQSTVELYTRLAPAMQRFGKTSEDAKNVVEGVSTALKLSGATAEEASSVMIQFSQAMNQGNLQGQEFNSVIKGAPLIVRALAKELNITEGQVKSFGSQGKLSVNTITSAIANALPGMRAAFSSLPITFADEIVRVKNIWEKSVGEMGQATGFNTSLAQALKNTEDLIPIVINGVGGAFAAILVWVDKNRESIGQIYNNLVGVGKEIGTISGEFTKLSGFILGAGEQVNFVALGLFTIRAILAGIIDIVHGVSAAFIHVGMDIAQVLLSPLVLVLSVMEDITNALGDFAGWLAKMAPAGSSVAHNMQSMADAIHSAGTRAEAAGIAVVGLTSSGRDLGDSLEKNLSEGNGELDKLLSGSEDAMVSFNGLSKSIGQMDSAWKKGNEVAINKAAEAAAAKEHKRFEDAKAAILAMIDEQVELNKRIDMFGLSYDKIGPAQKKVIDLQEQLVKMQSDPKLYSPQAIADEKALISLAEKAAMQEKLNNLKLEGLRTDQTWLDKEQSSVKSLQDQLSTVQAKLESYKSPKGTSDRVMVNQTQDRLNAVQSIPEDLQSPAVKKMIEFLQQELDIRKQIADVNAQIGQKDLGVDWDKLFDPTKATKFSDTMVASFGKIGKSLSGVISTFQKYEEGINRVAKAQKIAQETTDPTEQSKRFAQAADLERQTQVGAFADMAESAKGFFGVHTKGYEAMQAVEKGFRLYQMAMQLMSFLQESGFIATKTTLAVASDATVTASSVTGAATRTTASMTASAANAVEGITNEAKGDPYTAFGRMAAMAAIMAALGFAVGGIGGGGSANVSATRQAEQGTGTVLGDASKKSESIANSISILEKNSNIGLRYSSAMLTALEGIQSALTGATTSIVRSGGTITGTDYTNTKTSSFGNAVGSVVGSIFGSSVGGFVGSIASLFANTKKTLVDSGITAKDQTVGSVLSNGFQGATYQDVETKKKLFGITYSDKTSRNTTALDSDVSSAFTDIISGMVTTITQAGTALGGNATQIAASLAAVKLSLGSISLKGLTADEIQTQLEAVFSAFGDQLVQVGLGSMVSKFQQSGEGLLETAVRVANGVDTASVELTKLGISAINFQDIINTNGDVATEIVRQSIALKESGTTIAAIINNMSGSAADLGDTYTSLLSLRKGLQELNIAKDVTINLINAAGGLDALQSALDSYKKNFFTAAQQNSMDVADLAKQFTALGLAMPNTKADFVNLVNRLQASGEGGQELAVKVLLLSDAFSSLSDTVDSAISTATSNLTDAYNTQATTIQNTADAMSGFSTSLQAFYQTLTTSDLSTGNAVDKYNSQLALYKSTEAAAMAGDQTALSNFQSVANDLLTASRAVNASGDAYTTDYLQVMSDTAALASSTAAQASVAEQQLTALQTQVSTLITINTSVLSVADAITALENLIAGGVTGTSSTGSKSTILPVTTTVDGSHAMGLDRVPFDGYIAELHKDETVLTASESRAYRSSPSSSSSDLATQVAALTAEVAGLRADAAAQTSAIISSNYDATASAASTVVQGQQEAAATMVYADNLRPSIV